MHALGVLLIAPVLPRLAARFGARTLLVAALLLSAVLFPLFPAFPAIVMWFILRIGLGIAAETIFVLTESWVNDLSSDATRGRSMAAYTAILSLGFAGGPLILSYAGSAGATPYLIAAAISAMALVCVFFLPATRQSDSSEVSTNLLAYARLAPLAMAATTLNAAVETAGMSLMPLYAGRLGWEGEEAAKLITILMIGAIALQLPIGWLCDRMNRQTLLFALSVVSVAGALLWPYVIGDRVLAYVMVFVWGGLFVGIYTTMLAIVGSHYSGTDLIGIYAAMGLMWGVGALLGPTLAGFAMEATTHGLPFFIAASCGAFALYVVIPTNRVQERSA